MTPFVADAGAALPIPPCTTCRTPSVAVEPGSEPTYCAADGAAMPLHWIADETFCAAHWRQSWRVK